MSDFVELSSGMKMPKVKYRKPTYEELSKASLVYDKDTPMAPVFEATSTVWATAVHADDPTYRIYSRGTNDLVFFKVHSKY